jgi:carbonic anhydrase/acetyltransferase-like protein (isoleucine patch superfamily)
LNAETYLAVNHWMVQRLATGASHGDPLVHPTAVVAPGARIVGPVQLGAGAVVEAGATIVGPASIGPDSTVARDALVARSVLWRGCVVGAAAVVHGCIVGSGAVIPAATRLFNAVRPSASSFPAAEPARALRIADALPAPSPATSSPHSCTAA